MAGYFIAICLSLWLFQGFLIWKTWTWCWERTLYLWRLIMQVINSQVIFLPHSWHCHLLFITGIEKQISFLFLTYFIHCFEITFSENKILNLSDSYIKWGNFHHNMIIKYFCHFLFYLNGSWITFKKNLFTKYCNPK